MQRLNKPFEPITTLVIIYFALVTVSIALYALIQIFFKSDTATATGLLGWTANIFATIALLYTYNNWKNEKRSEVVIDLARESINNDISISNTISLIKNNNYFYNTKNINDLENITNQYLNTLFILIKILKIKETPINKYYLKLLDLREKLKPINGNDTTAIEYIKKIQLHDKLYIDQIIDIISLRDKGT